MALHPITQYDFPNSTEYDGDLREVLALTRKVYNEYNSMYNGFLELESNFATIQSGFAALQTNVNNLNNNMRATVQAAVDAYTSATDSDINARFTAINKQLTEYKTELTAKMEHYVKDIYALYRQNKLDTDSAIAALRADFAEYKTTETSERKLDIEKCRALVLQLCEDLREDYTRKLEEMRQRIDDIVKEYPQIWNMARGEKTDLESAVIDCYDALRYFAMQPRDFDYAQKTAGEWDEIEIPAIVFDTAGRDVIDPIRRVVNPFTDEMDDIGAVMDYISRELLARAITCDEWNACENIPDIDAFNAFVNADYGVDAGLTARQFKFYSYDILYRVTVETVEELARDLALEKTARAQGDENLTTLIDAVSNKLTSDITQERETRAQGDENLSKLVDAVSNSLLQSIKKSVDDVKKQMVKYGVVVYEIYRDFLVDGDDNLMDLNISISLDDIANEIRTHYGIDNFTMRNFGQMTGFVIGQIQDLDGGDLVGDKAVMVPLNGSMYTPVTPEIQDTYSHKLYLMLSLVEHGIGLHCNVTVPYELPSYEHQLLLRFYLTNTIDY